MLLPVYASLAGVPIAVSEHLVGCQMGKALRMGGGPLVLSPYDFERLLLARWDPEFEDVLASIEVLCLLDYTKPPELPLSFPFRRP